MNTRRFYLISSTIISIFLFLCGSILLFYLNFADDNLNANDPLSSLLDPLKSLKLGKGPMNILVMGGDKVNKNSDTMLLVNFDPSTAKLNIMSIPRDTKVKVKGSNVPKVNSAYPAGGAQRAVETVSSLLNVKIKYYVFVDTAALAKIVDKLGGVDFNIPANMDYEDPVQNLRIHLKKGQQHLNGTQVVQFMRFRQANKWTGEISKYYDGSDVKRIEAQQKMIKEIIRQKANVFYLTKVNDILNIIFKNVETNITFDEALNLSRNLNKISLSNVNLLILPGNPVDEGLSYFIVDKPKADEVVKQYFQSSQGLSKSSGSTPAKDDQDSKPPAPAKNNPSNAPAKTTNSTNKSNVTKDNPSNSDTAIEGTKEPGP